MNNNERKKFEVWWDEEKGILRSKFRGDADEESAREQMAVMLRLAQSQPGKILALNDLTEAGKASSGARKIFAQLLQHEKFARHAFFGMKTLTRIIVSFIMNFAGAKNARYFDTEEEAIKWLKS